MAMPPEIHETENKLETTVKAKEAAVENQEFEKAASLRDKQEKIRAELNDAKTRWREKKSGERLVVDDNIISEVVSIQHNTSITLAAKAADLCKPHVVQQEDDNIGRTIRRLQRFGPPLLALFVAFCDLALELLLGVRVFNVRDKARRQ